MALGSTQLLAKISARYLPGGKGRPARKDKNLSAICQAILYKMWEPRRLTNLWASTACQRDSLIFKTRSSGKFACFPLIRHGQHRKRHLQQFFVTTGKCLSSHCLATIREYRERERERGKRKCREVAGGTTFKGARDNFSHVLKVPRQ
jgi:hypothetical protein